MRKTLVLDIETAPMLVFVWALKDQYITVDQVYKDWHLMAWSAKWYNEPASKIIYYDQRNAADIANDKGILKPLWNMLDEAEVVITQNGEKFDAPKINARFILNGMKPPSPYKHLDTFRLLKTVAKFTSHSLDYLTDKLNVKYKKLSHKDFPGRSLWTQCLAGNKKAWDCMKEYNIHDVLSTEELYNNVKAWAPPSMTKLFNMDQSMLMCRICGSPAARRGFDWKGKKRVQRLRCNSCGAWDTMLLPKAGA